MSEWSTCTCAGGSPNLWLPDISRAPVYASIITTRSQREDCLVELVTKLALSSDLVIRRGRFEIICQCVTARP